MIKEYRNLRGYTQEKLAELVEVDIRTIQRIEKMEVIPSLETFAKLTLILNIDFKDVIVFFQYITKRP